MSQSVNLLAESGIQGPSGDGLVRDSHKFQALARFFPGEKRIYHFESRFLESVHDFQSSCSFQSLQLQMGFSQLSQSSQFALQGHSREFILFPIKETAITFKILDLTLATFSILSGTVALAYLITVAVRETNNICFGTISFTFHPKFKVT